MPKIDIRTIDHFSGNAAVQGKRNKKKNDKSRSAQKKTVRDLYN